jgi:two-component system, chemotaxis family, CheB/CheR fusion protein
MPYKTSKNVIDGATITFQDISHMKNIQKKIQSALHYAEDIINTVREPLLVLDRNLMVISANKSYYETFNLKKSLTEGEKLNDIGVGEWNIPSLQKILIDILEVNSEMNDFEFEHDFKDVGHKKMLLNARRIYRGDMDTEMILLAMEDVKV